jgi:lipoprotein-anchoring transpeptidase ErfK/SrfK
MLSRRAVIKGAAAGLLAAPLSTAAFAQSSEDDPYPLPKFDYNKLPEAFRPTVVNYTGRQWPGTIIVDTQARQLYLVLQGGKAMRWGCAVGKDGFRWAGLADVGR